MQTVDLQPGETLDRLFAERVEGYVWDETRCRICGWPLATDRVRVGCAPGDCSMRPQPRHRADGIAPVSTDNAVALAALERFAEKHNAGWDIERMLLSDKESRYSVFVYGSAVPCHAPTLALAITRALLAAVEGHDG